MTAIYADVSKVKETVNEMEKKKKDIKITKEEIKTTCRDGKEKRIQIPPCATCKKYYKYD